MSGPTKFGPTPEDFESQRKINILAAEGRGPEFPETFTCDKEPNSHLRQVCVHLEDYSTLRRSYDALAAELEAVRELMNVYNLGGWTDALGPMKRALAAESALAAMKAERRWIPVSESLPEEDELVEVWVASYYQKKGGNDFAVYKSGEWHNFRFSQALEVTYWKEATPAPTADEVKK